MHVRGMAAGSPDEVTVVEDMGADMVLKRYTQSAFSGRHMLKSAQIHMLARAWVPYWERDPCSVAYTAHR